MPQSPGALLLAMASQPELITWWDAVDRIGFDAQHTALARFTYPISTQGVITAGIHVDWPPLPFGVSKKLGQTTWGINITLAQW